jgi:hypothetical protein
MLLCSNEFFVVTAEGWPLAISTKLWISGVGSMLGAYSILAISRIRLQTRIIPLSSPPQTSNNIIQKGLAFGREPSGSVTAQASACLRISCPAGCMAEGARSIRRLFGGGQELRSIPRFDGAAGYHRLDRIRGRAIAK